MKRVLSIQSHVVHGYVGNKAAVFPLQLLGFDVDVVNSVHFSNHTGYPQKWEGDVLNGSQLASIMNGLERNCLLKNIGHLLTGYIGSESFLRAVLDVVQTLKEHNCDDFRFVCDPVFGDNGKLYVPKELVKIYREEVIPLANVVTPNQFEVEQLTGISVRTMDDAKKACRMLHDLGPELVIITSMALDEQSDTIAILASERITTKAPVDGTAKEQKEVHVEDHIWCIDSPILEGNYTGTGDLCAALLLAWTSKEPNNLESTLPKVISTMFSVIKTTMERMDGSGSVASKELKLIQSKDVIENPPALFQARRI